MEQDIPTIPIGYIVPLSTPGITRCPDDGRWLPCDGRFILQKEYPEAVALLSEGHSVLGGTLVAARIPYLPGSIIKVRP